ncbi:MAG: CBS domain-containing protein [Chloroflexota bacterium]
MKLKEIMTRDVEIVRPQDTLQTAAQKMRDRDIGFLPVFEKDELIGALTDRDLVMRGVAEGMNSKATLGREFATSPAIYCYENQDAEDAAQLMNKYRIRRLVVLNPNNHRLAGVVSMGDLAGIVSESLANRLFQGVSASVKTPA